MNLRLTRNSTIFVFLALVYSGLFFYLLFSSIMAQTWGRIGYITSGYAIMMFLTGLLLGATDPVQKSLW